MGLRRHLVVRLGVRLVVVRVVVCVLISRMTRLTTRGPDTPRVRPLVTQITLSFVFLLANFRLATSVLLGLPMM